ncbi:MAG TPA: hypothetical protein VEV41_14425 [Terriglobales bacterium]|nr:hypothetical protein [Terriglobales bacterium]
MANRRNHQKRTDEQLRLLGGRLGLQHRRPHVAAVTAHRFRGDVETVGDGIQHVAAQKLAVDAEQPRVGADGADACHWFDPGAAATAPVLNAGTMLRKSKKKSDEHSRS